MNAFARFVRLGNEDADRRVAAMLSPDDLHGTDRYLKQSRVVSAIDRMTRLPQAWWMSSASGRFVTAMSETFRQSPLNERLGSIGVVVLTAVAAHVALTVVNGARPGWFWLIIPALAALFAALLLAAGRDHRS